jgi:hypothetical protein
VSGIGGFHRLATVAGNAAGEHHPRPHARGGAEGTGRFEDVAPAVEVDAERVVEALLALAADHRGEVEDGGRGLRAQGGRHRGAVGDVAGDGRHPDRRGTGGGAGGRHRPREHGIE